LNQFGGASRRIDVPSVHDHHGPVEPRQLMRFWMRCTRRARWLRCALLVAALCSVPAVASAQKTRDEAVQAARRGEFDVAVPALRALLAASPADTATASTSPLSSVGGPRTQATDVFERTGVAEPPEYVLGEMVRAYRTERRWAEAGALASQGVRRFPANPQWPLAVWMAGRRRRRVR
jgi:hypothetical protein